MKIDRKRLSAEQIGKIASDFLAKNNKNPGGYPIQIELIAERLGIRITPIPGLKRDLSGIEGFIRPDLTEIVIDEKMYFDYPNRARFTIAHEIGHFVLHQDVFEQVRKAMNPKTFEEYSSFLLGKIPEEDYDWIEWQSFEFAGRVLVPRAELENKLGKLVEPTKNVTDDVAHTIIEELAAYFEVSTHVIGKRIKKEGLVEIFLQKSGF